MNNNFISYLTIHCNNKKATSFRRYESIEEVVLFSKCQFAHLNHVHLSLFQETTYIRLKNKR
jgi:hypothetical protein